MLEKHSEFVNNYFKEFQKRFPKNLSSKFLQKCQGFRRENLEFFRNCARKFFRKYQHIFRKFFRINFLVTFLKFVKGLEESICNFFRKRLGTVLGGFREGYRKEYREMF